MPLPVIVNFANLLAATGIENDGVNRFFAHIFNGLTLERNPGLHRRFKEYQL